MRAAVVLLLLLASAAVAGPALHLGYDADHLDLDKHVLQFKPSRAVRSATIVAIGEDGSAMGSGSASYDTPVDGSWWSISWSQPADARVMVLRLRAVTPDGVATTLELIPWSVTIAHDDVN